MIVLSVRARMCVCVPVCVPVCVYSHAGALLAASVSRAHVGAAVSDVEVVQSPGLLLVKRSLLEPAEPGGRGPDTHTHTRTHTHTHTRTQDYDMNHRHTCESTPVCMYCTLCMYVHM